MAELIITPGGPPLPVTVPNGGTGLATLTSGSLIVGAGTSTPTFLAPGSNGNVAVVAGGVWTSAAPTAAASGWTLIPASTVTAVGAATMDIEWSTTSYDVFAIVLSGMTCATDAVNFLLRMKISGSYDTASNYLYSQMAIDSGNNGFYGNTTAGGAQSSILLAVSQGNAAARSGDHVIYVYNPSSTAFLKQVNYNGTYVRSNGNITSAFGVGGNSGTGALTGIRIFASSGNLSGVGRLYGLQNS